MSLMLQEGARGVLVRDVQKALVNLGQLMVVDGIYGPVTAAGVRALFDQNHVGPQVARDLGLDTRLDYRVLGLISFFEGSGWNSGHGEFDAGVLTVGPYGLTLGTGYLHQFIGDLRSIVDSDQWERACAINGPFQILYEASGVDRDRAIDMVRAAVPDRTRLPSDWEVAVRLLMGLDGARELMRHYWMKYYWEPSQRAAAEYRVDREHSPGGIDPRGSALMADIWVQLGPLELTDHQRASLSATYPNRMVQIARFAAAEASERWRDHVLERKTGIAHGSGRYRGIEFNLADFGLGKEGA